MGDERRAFERELVDIPFIYSMDEGNSFSEGEWFEARTVDIGPVLVGGLAFLSDKEFKIGDPIRIALFMDLELKKVWEKDPDHFPAIYSGEICRITETDEGPKIAVLFKGFEKEVEERLHALEDEITS